MEVNGQRAPRRPALDGDARPFESARARHRPGGLAQRRPARLGRPARGGDRADRAHEPGLAARGRRARAWLLPELRDRVSPLLPRAAPRGVSSGGLDRHGRRRGAARGQHLLGRGDRLAAAPPRRRDLAPARALRRAAVPADAVRVRRQRRRRRAAGCSAYPAVRTTCCTLGARFSSRSACSAWRSRSPPSTAAWRERAPRVLRGVAAAIEGSWRAARTMHWRLLGAAGFLCLDMGALWAATAATGHPLGVLALAIAYCIGYLATMIPMPAGPRCARLRAWPERSCSTGSARPRPWAPCSSTTPSRSGFRAWAGCWPGCPARRSERDRARQSKLPLRFGELALPRPAESEA